MNQQDRVVIMVGRQRDGANYTLHPRTRAQVEERFPHVHPVPSIFVGYDTQADFEAIHGPMWPQIATMLSGVDAKRLSEVLGPIVLRLPQTDEEFAVEV